MAPLSRDIVTQLTWANARGVAIGTLSLCQTT